MTEFSEMMCLIFKTIKVFEGTESIFKKFLKNYLSIFAFDVFIDDISIFLILPLSFLNFEIECVFYLLKFLISFFQNIKVYISIQFKHTVNKT